MSVKALPIFIVLVDELALLFMEVWTEINRGAAACGKEVSFFEAQPV